MKKIILLSLIVSIVLVSCVDTKNTYRIVDTDNQEHVVTYASCYVDGFYVVCCNKYGYANQCFNDSVEFSIRYKEFHKIEK